MKRFAALLLAGCFGLVVTPACAQDSEEKWYEVEIILFENLAADAINEEHWPADPGQLETEGLIELTTAIKPPVEPFPATEKQISESSPAAVVLDEPATDIDSAIPVAYEILPAENYRLNAQFEKLAQSDKYLPLVHIAWRQIVPEREAPDRIHIHSYLTDESSIKKPSPTPVDEFTSDLLALPPSISEVIADSAALEELKVPTLNGILKIGKGRYLHVDADLMLYKPELKRVTELPSSNLFVPELPTQFNETNDAEAEFIAVNEIQRPDLFRIQNSLRLRSGDIHYMDHPLIGMLILFTPYTLPEPDITDVTPEVDSGMDQLQ